MNDLIDEARRIGFKYITETLTGNGSRPRRTQTARRDMSEGSFHKRCAAFLTKLRQDAILRQGDPVADLMTFVISERGKNADPKLADTLPLVLYFGSEQDRDEFMEVVREAKPNLMTRKMP